MDGGERLAINIRHFVLWAWTCDSASLGGPLKLLISWLTFPLSHFSGEEAFSVERAKPTAIKLNATKGIIVPSFSWPLLCTSTHFLPDLISLVPWAKTFFTDLSVHLVEFGITVHLVDWINMPPCSGTVCIFFPVLQDHLVDLKSPQSLLCFQNKSYSCCWLCWYLSHLHGAVLQLKCTSKLLMHIPNS